MDNFEKKIILGPLFTSSRSPSGPLFSILESPFDLGTVSITLKVKYLICSLYTLLQVGYEQQCCIRRGESLVVKHQGQDGDGGDGKQGGDYLRISLLTPPQVVKAI